MSIAEITKLNFEQLVTLCEDVSKTLTRIEAEKQYQDLLEIRMNQIKMQNMFDKSNAVMEQIRKSQNAANTRLANLESSIASKLDKSEFENLEAAAMKIELYEEFRVEALSAMRILHLFQATTEEKLKQQADQITNMSNDLILSKNLLALKCSNQEMNLLADEIKSVSSALRQCATLANLSQVFYTFK